MSSDQQIADGQRTRQRMLDYIADHQERHGWAPTMGEIAEAVGLASKASVHRHLQKLAGQGELVLGNGPRMIRLTGGRIALRPPASTTALRPDQLTARHVGADGRLEPGR